MLTHLVAEYVNGYGTPSALLDRIQAGFYPHEELDPEDKIWIARTREMIRELASKMRAEEDEYYK